MGWLGFARDFRRTIDASSPNEIKATELEGRSMELVIEARDENAALTDDDREARRSEARRLKDEADRLHAAAQQPWKDLAARHPGKIQY